MGIEMPKFDAKKEDFAKIWQKLGAIASPLPPTAPPMDQLTRCKFYIQSFYISFPSEDIQSSF